METAIHASARTRRSMDDSSSSTRPEPGADPAVAGKPRVPARAIVADAVRHVLPLASLYLFNGNFANYALLTAFDLSLGLVLIFNTTRGSDRGTGGMTVDPRSRWLVSRVVAVLLAATFMAIEAAIIAIPVSMPAYISGLSSGVDWRALGSHPGFSIPVAAMSLLAAVRFQSTFEARTTLGPRGQPTFKGAIVGNPEEDRKRSLAANAAQVTLIATFAFLCYGLIPLGRWGLYALPILYATLLVFYDTRPDVAQRIFPKLWQKK
ncbi:MAG: hypothetical protein ACHQM4_03035 [Thermoanaerobaculia bacterium]